MLARKTPTVVVVAALAATLTCAGVAQAKTSRVGPDRTFGDNGWATVAAPSGSYVAPFATQCAAADGRYYIASATKSLHNRKANGGVVRALNSRGKSVSEFGEGGALRMDRAWRSLEIEPLGDRSFLVYGEVRKGAKRVWRVRRVSKKGKLQRSFGDRGSISVEGLASSREPPIVARIADRGFTIVQTSVDGDGFRSRISVFDFSGRLDHGFGKDGYVELPFHVDAIASAAERILVSGHASDLRIVKLQSDGSPDLEWGVAGTVSISEMPKSVIDAVGRVPWNQTGPFFDRVQAADADDGEVIFVADVSAYESSGSWAMRLDNRGLPKSNWGDGGSALLGTDFISSEVGMDIEYSNYTALKHGRTLRVHSNEGNPEYDSVKFQLVDFETRGASGRAGSADSKRLSVRNRLLLDLAFDETEDRAILCFTNGRKVAVARARI